MLRVSMEEESYLRLLLTGSPPALLGTPPSEASPSQASPLVSAIPRGPPPVPCAQAPALEQHWSNAVVRFLLSQCKEHVELYNTITMQQHHWERIHGLLITQFPQESGRKVKSLSDKWEKLWNTHSKMKKLQNQTGEGARDDGAKFIWYDEIDEILSLTAKVVGVRGGMDQGVSIPETWTSNALINVSHEDDGDAEPSSTQSPTCSSPATGTKPMSTSSNPQTRAANLASVCGKGTSFQPAKKPRIERNFMDALDRMTKSNIEIKKLWIETIMAMHKDNLVERQEQRKLELEKDQLQQESSERMVVMFADVIKKIAK